MTADDAAVVGTSIIAALKLYDSSELPDTILMTAVTLGELSFGPHATDDPVKRAGRVAVLQQWHGGQADVPLADRLAPSLLPTWHVAAHQRRRLTGRVATPARVLTKRRMPERAAPHDRLGRRTGTARRVGACSSSRRAS